MVSASYESANGMQHSGGTEPSLFSFKLTIEQTGDLS